jgi:hypothetical protein
VAQTVTNFLIFLTLKDFPEDQLVIDTMIDNVRFASSDRNILFLSCKKFLYFCDLFQVQVNEREKYTDSFFFSKCNQEQIFLGECYNKNKVYNTEKNINKLKMAIKKLEEEENTLTYRNLISLLSLLFFLVHTLFSPTGPFYSFASFFSLIRFYSSLSSLAAKDGFDGRIKYVQEKRKKEILNLAKFLFSSPFALLSPNLSISLEHINYGALIIVDACAGGWAAFIFFPFLNKTLLLQQRFNKNTREKILRNKNFSAHTEPLGALRALNFAKKYIIDNKINNKRVALVTDHAPIVFAQRKLSSFYSGFSSSFLLNNLFLSFYNDGWDNQAWYVAGPLNPADDPSRAIPPSSSLIVSPSTFAFPHLSSFFHPYL